MYHMMYKSDMYHWLFICILCQACSNGICNPCPSTCISCDSESYCHECIPGFYGAACSYTCKSYCRNNTCSKFMGLCNSCEDGYFLNNDILCSRCPTNCLKCVTTEICSQCVTGFRGEICHERCINCKPGTPCDKHKGNCIKCDDGFSGLSCDTKCNPKCLNCKRLEKDECTMCSHDTYGANCNYKCSNNCLEATCNYTDGSCRLGCSKGYWGNMCNYTCDAICQDNRCSRIDGHCTLVPKAGVKRCVGQEKSYSAICPNCDCLHSGP